MIPLNNLSLNNLYRLGGRDDPTMYGGPTFAQLRKGSLEKLMDALKEKTEFDRNSTFLDIGAGLNLPALHATTEYCGFAAGVEVDPSYTKSAARLTTDFFVAEKDGGREINPHVGLICIDAMSLPPLSFFSHIYMFDKVFPPELHNHLLDLLAVSEWKVLVCFNKDFWKSVRSNLDVDEVLQVGNLCSAISGERHTAAIFKRRSNTVRVPSEAKRTLANLLSKTMGRNTDEAIEMYKHRMQSNQVDTFPSLAIEVKEDRAFLRWNVCAKTKVRAPKACSIPFVHSCQPNGRLAGEVLELLTDVRAGECLSIDHGRAFTDALPGDCSCCAPGCRKAKKMVFLGMVQHDSRRLECDLSPQHTRDLLRCVEAETFFKAAVFSVDKNQKVRSVADQMRHFVEDFTRVGWVDALVEKGVSVQHICMDFINIPPNWTAAHWPKSFYAVVLPHIAKKKLLTQTGCIWLPFEVHTLQMLSAHKSKWSKHFSIQARARDCSSPNPLWVASMNQADEIRKSGKDPYVELQKYCSFSTEKANLCRKLFRRSERPNRHSTYLCLMNKNL